MARATYAIEDLQAWAAELGGRCLSLNYKNSKHKYMWECGQCATQWEASWYNVKNHNSWCPSCVSSYREALVRECFKEGFPGEGFQKNQTAVGMELDGYSVRLKLAFEHDGIQHRVRVPHFQRKLGAFEAQQDRDRRKDQLCAEKHITLVRVPDRLVLQVTKIRDYVRNTLIELGYELAPKSPDEEFYGRVRVLRVQTDYLAKVVVKLRDAGETLLSDLCPTRTSPLSVRCPHGHVYTTSYDNVVRNRGCPECCHSRKKGEAELEAMVVERGYLMLYVERRKDAHQRSRCYITLNCPNGHEPFEMLLDNFNKGRGCLECGSARTGASKRCASSEIKARFLAIDMGFEGEYRSIVKPLIFVCSEGHRFTSSLKKVELSPPNARCPVCTATAFDDVELLDAYGPETSSAKTKLRWRCRICETETVTTYRGMRIRKHRCGNTQCPTRQ